MTIVRTFLANLFGKPRPFIVIDLDVFSPTGSRAVTLNGNFTRLEPANRDVGRAA